MKKVKLNKSLKSLVKISHGGWSYLRTAIVPPCKVCLFGKEGQCPRYDPNANDCKVILKMQDKLIKKIMSLPHIQDTDIICISEMVKDWGFLHIIDKWLSVKSPFKEKFDGLEVQEILKIRWTIANSMHRLTESLGLTPSSRAKLKLDSESGGDFGKGIIDIGKEEDPNG
jgi:hypothetical protein